ncbi:unnamed protein product [Diplocarpon coronariae]
MAWTRCPSSAPRSILRFRSQASQFTRFPLPQKDFRIPRCPAAKADGIKTWLAPSRAAPLSSTSSHGRTVVVGDAARSPHLPSECQGGEPRPG